MSGTGQPVVQTALLLYLQVVNVEGPMVAMEVPYIGRSINAGGVMEVGVELKGPSALPVTAYLTVAQRLLSPSESALAPTDALYKSSCEVSPVPAHIKDLVLAMCGGRGGLRVEVS